MEDTVTNVTPLSPPDSTSGKDWLVERIISIVPFAWISDDSVREVIKATMFANDTV